MAGPTSPPITEEQLAPPDPAVAALVDILQHAPWDFYQPTSRTHAAPLPAAKRFLDPLAADISREQLARLQEGRKRKRRGGRAGEREREEVLRLKRIHTEGFGWGQVWEQARRVLDAAVREIGRDLDELEDGEGKVRGDEKVNGEVNGDTTRVPHDSSEDGHSSDAEGLDSEDELAKEDLRDGISEEEGFEDAASDQILSGEEFDGIEEGEEDIIASDDDYDSKENENGQADVFVEDVHGLNDGFFSIDAFNRQTEFLEQVDARGDPDDGAASDEEDVNWDADPLAESSTLPTEKTARDAEVDESDDDDDEEDGPTFGNMDLDAPEGASDEEGDDMLLDDEEGGNTENLMYRDFFAPPARKASKSKKKDESRTAQVEEYIGLNTSDDDMQRTISAVHRDLFSDGEDDNDGRNEPNGPSGPLSTHERRQAALIKQIRELEAANVAKREWTLSGEARAADRPVNSLLAEDLDFERAGKPVPVITQEVTEDIEAMIKRRILAKDFDEVLRRRPDEALSGVLGRRGALEEVQDTKSKKGLAELYEEEHLRRTDPNYVDARDERLKAEHREIESLWKDISAKLDALANWNYRPRPVEMSIQVRSDAPVVVLEDARPSGVGGSELATTSQLAPQEVYRAGQDLQKGEVATKGGTVLAKDEMSREDNKRIRRQKKERARKAAANNSVNAVNGKQDAKRNEKNKVVKNLKQGGVMIVDPKGNLSTVDGKKARGNKAFMTPGMLKL